MHKTAAKITYFVHTYSTTLLWITWNFQMISLRLCLYRKVSIKYNFVLPLTKFGGYRWQCSQKEQNKMYLIINNQPQRDFFSHILYIFSNFLLITKFTFNTIKISQFVNAFSVHLRRLKCFADFNEIVVQSNVEYSVFGEQRIKNSKLSWQ